MNRKILFLFIALLAALPALGAEPAEAPAENTPASYQAGLESLKVRNWIQAETFFETYLKARSGNSEVYEALARAQLNLEELDPAFENVQKALKLDPHNAEAYATLLGIHQKKGNWMEGLNARDQALKINPKIGRIYYYAGCLYLEQMLIEEAAASFEKAAALEADFPDLHRDLGKAYYEQGLYDRALEEFRQALKKNSGDGEAQRGIAESLEKKGKIKQAMEAYQKAAVINPKDAESHYRLGELYEKSKKKNEAIAAYYESVKADPDFLKGYKKLGPLANEEKDWDKALLAYEKMAELQPDIMDLSHLAFLYQMKGMTEKAISAYEKTLEINPEDQVAHYNLAVIYQKLEKLDDAEKHYVKAREADPEDPSYAAGLATVYCKKKEPFLAWKTFESNPKTQENVSLKNYLTSACPRNAAATSAPTFKDYVRARANSSAEPGLES